MAKVYNICFTTCQATGKAAYLMISCLYGTVPRWLDPAQVYRDTICRIKISRTRVTISKRSLGNLVVFTTLVSGQASQAIGASVARSQYRPHVRRNKFNLCCLNSKARRNMRRSNAKSVIIFAGLIRCFAIVSLTTATPVMLRISSNRGRPCGSSNFPSSVEGTCTVIFIQLAV